MTSQEMLNLWKVGFEVLASNSAPGFDDSDIYILLNRAQDLIIEELVQQKDWLRLQNIIVIDGYLANLHTLKRYYVNLPSNYFYYISSYSTMKRSPITVTGFIGDFDASINTNFVNDDIILAKAEDYLPTSFNAKRIFKHPKAYISEGKLYVIIDDYTTIDSIVIKYIKKRTEIGVGNCDLDASLHRIVVEKAIDLAKKTIFIQEPQSSN